MCIRDRENPLPLYTVEFKASELWGISAENSNDSIYLELWEPKLKSNNT